MEEKRQLTDEELENVSGGEIYFSCTCPGCGLNTCISGPEGYYCSTPGCMYNKNEAETTPNSNHRVITGTKIT